MPRIKTRDGTKLYVKDWNDGDPVILIHGWPLDADMWERQALALAEAGYRVIAYDRRGFGRSGQPWDGYDYDTFADDLKSVMEEMKAKDAALVGFSMGGGEVARYLGRHGPKNVSKAVLIGAVPPFLLKTDDNPNGLPRDAFEARKAAIRKDRAAFAAEFAPGFYGHTRERPVVSDEVLQWTANVALLASLKATIDCVDAFGTTDFRDDMKAFAKVPTLIVHGTADANVPIEISARVSKALVPHAVLKEYEGAAHGLFFTHADRLTADLLEFLKD